MNDTHIIALVKGGEVWIAIWTARYRNDVTNTFRRWADNHDLNFSRFNAATLSQRVREVTAETLKQTRRFAI